MFEAAELGRRVSRKAFDAALPKLRAALLEAQRAVAERQIPVLIIVSGADGAGKGRIVQRLNEWLDPRFVETHAFWQSSDEEQERPRYWRFWRALPSRGRIGILFGSWYTEPIIRRVFKQIDKSGLDSELDRIAFFEHMLASDGAVIIKLWFHLPKKAQRKQLEDLDRNPRTHWRVTPMHWKHLKMYDKFIKVSERAIRRTDAGHAPWHLIEATDRRHRELTAAQVVLETLQARLDAPVPQRHSAPKPRRSTPTGQAPTILDRVNLRQRLAPARYEQQLAHWQGELSHLAWAANQQRISAVILFEGWDAAGKGSAIRRVTAAMDPRLYRVVPVAAPTDEERGHHYLWRFWRHLPRAGRIVIFDRSWYGRVLVERVEGFAQPAEWQRAYLEINEFEEQLAGGGIALAKFWLHISKDEQLRRFQERQTTDFKRHKITAEDWRNRKRWDAYEAAVNDMVTRTSTGLAPWTLVAGNDKRFARVQILRTLCEILERAL